MKRSAIHHLLTGMLISVSWALSSHAAELSYQMVDPVLYTSHLKGIASGLLAQDHVVTVTPGEYEPLGIVLHPSADSASVKAVLGTFRSASGATIDAQHVDLKVAKKWYQSSYRRVNPDRGRFLIYELLLNNEQLIRVDENREQNYLLTEDAGYIDISSESAVDTASRIIRDAETLQNFSIEKDVEKLLWLTVHAPPDTKPGRYDADLELRDGTTLLGRVGLSIEVLPFSLKESSLDYGLYYRARLTNKPVISADWKSADNYYRDLENMYRHGVRYPTLYEKLDSGNVEQALAIRDRLAFPRDNIFVLGLNAGAGLTNGDNSKRLDNLRRSTQQWKALIETFGYQTLYVYAVDEAKKDDLVKQLPGWHTVKTAGGKIFAACHIGAIDYIGDELDLPVLARQNSTAEGRLRDAEALRWKRKVPKVYIYYAPQVGVEDPEVYRINYGFWLWLSPYDGVINYAYQHGFEDIWNDFDDPRLRDHVFTYPSSGGPIDTIQWEGFREAVDDSRYADKLASLIGRQQAEQFILQSLNDNKSMAEVRRDVVGEILRVGLRKAPKPPASLNATQP